MLESIRSLSGWHRKHYRTIYKLFGRRIVNKMNRMVTWNLQRQLDLEANCQVTGRQTKYNLENGQEYAGLTETPCHNMMLDKRVLRTKERHAGHGSFLPQEVVRREVWTRGLQRRHSYRRRFLRRETQSTTHPNEWVRYTFQPQFVVHGHRYQDEARTSVILNQP